MMNSNGHAVDDLEGQNLKKNQRHLVQCFVLFFF